jgi:hypothetical protein
MWRELRCVDTDVTNHHLARGYAEGDRSLTDRFRHRDESHPRSSRQFREPLGILSHGRSTMATFPPCPIDVYIIAVKRDDHRNMERSSDWPCLNGLNAKMSVKKRRLLLLQTGDGRSRYGACVMMKAPARTIEQGRRLSAQYRDIHTIQRKLMRLTHSDQNTAPRVKSQDLFLDESLRPRKHVARINKDGFHSVIDIRLGIDSKNSPVFPASYLSARSLSLFDVIISYRRRSSMRRTSWSLRAMTLLVPLFVCSPSAAQIGFDRPIEGSTGGLSDRTGSLAQSDLSPGTKVHLDPYGKRCVAVTANAHAPPDFRKIFSGAQSSLRSEDGKEKASSSNGATPKLFEHIISAKNHCALTIRLRVCYRGSQTCMPLEVPPYGHQQAILGMSSSGPDFRYQYTEQF